MARAGSKPIYDDKIADEVLAGIAVGMTEKAATAAAGISEDTWARWLKGQRSAPADLADRFARARPRRVRRWLGGLWELAQHEDPAIRLKALGELFDRCEPDYRKTERHELTGKDGAALRIEVVYADRHDHPA